MSTVLLAVIAVGAAAVGAPAGPPTARADSAHVGSIALSPLAITLQNASEPGASAPPQERIVVTLTVLDPDGNPIGAGSPLSQPIQITVYGPPSNPVTAQDAVISEATDTVYFDYTGAPVSNSIVVTAVSGRAFASMVFQPAHRGLEGTVAQTFEMQGEAQTVANGWTFQVSLGGGPTHDLLMDTGSIGVVVPTAVLGPGAIGPGAAAQIEYTSDGRIFHGHYYLTPLTITAGGARISTVPIQVLGVDSTSCDPAYPTCQTGGLATLGMMGVGFGRKEAVGALPPELDNPLLALQPIMQGTMRPGYIVQAGSVTLGITSQNSTGVTWIDLQPSTTIPGDWQAPAGCFGFPALPAFHALCGTMLVDTGIASMILGLPAAQRPPGIADTIPTGTQIQIMAPDASGAALSYEFRVGDGGAMTPTSIRWSGDAQPFVNTGRRLIAGYDYLFDAAGRVGFRPSR